MRIKVEGLDQLRRDLRRVGPELSRELKTVFNEAGQPIVSQAKRGVAKRSGRLERTVRAAASQREGRIRMGTPARRPPVVGGYRPTRERFTRGGQVLLDAFYNSRENQQAVHRAMDRGLERVIRKAGLR